MPKFCGLFGVSSLMENMQIITSTWCKKDYIQLLQVLRGYPTGQRVSRKLCRPYVKILPFVGPAESYNLVKSNLMSALKKNRHDLPVHTERLAGKG